MPLLKKPLLSFSAVGRIGRLFTIRRRKRDHIFERIPTPTDAKSPAQLIWRTMYQACTALWHNLSEAEQQIWESNARPLHMTGYAWFISQCLRPNPGIYLPLAGGTMTGDIDMGANKIEDLPAPSVASEPSRKAELDAHAATLDVHTRNPFQTMRLGENYLVTPQDWASVPSSTALAADRHHAMPLNIPRLLTVDRIAICVTSAAAAGKKARLGIYSAGANLTPGALLLDAGEVSVDSTGVKVATINQQLSKGLYWLSIVSDGTPSIRWVNAGPNQLLVDEAEFYYSRPGVYNTHSYGALPDPFGGSVVEFASNAPIVGLRPATLD